ncbi:sugar ABC transporter substrate-binding protein [Aquamicrobium sp. LC103]|uniref:ABC transporter substrate-binding protein n=1 Tax=Aquamicrobium sp. LC103 TaxID=1120658 RepID=UPI00063E9829|nr:sugar ABC transporter substrate-binding protein [Aquamicrobium sp. LC103]
MSAVLALAMVPAHAQDGFDWRKHDGETVNLMLNNLAWTQQMRDRLDEFTTKTGIKLRVETYSEEQYRARLTTLLQGGSSDLDVFMTLPSREAPLFQANGWYADLTSLLKGDATDPAFEYEDFSQALRDSGVVGETVTSLPINVEGPLFYWRKDVFEKCGLEKPANLEELSATAAKLKECDSAITPWAARGLRGTVGYPLGGFVYNSGGDFKDADGKATLCLPGTIKGIDLYGSLLREYGPPGATNHTFTQVIDLLAQGRVAMSNESSNEFSTLMRYPGRSEDIAVGVLPPGADGTSKPIVINWSLAISGKSQKQEAAWYFLQWATGKEVQNTLAQNGIAPSRVSVFNGDDFKAWASESRPRGEWLEALLEISQTGTSLYQTPTLTRTPEAREILSSVVQQVILGQNDAEAAACAVTEQVQALQD